MSLLEVRNVKRVYTTRLGAVKVQALSDVNFSVEEGEYVAIIGIRQDHTAQHSRLSG